MPKVRVESGRMAMSHEWLCTKGLEMLMAYMPLGFLDLRPSARWADVVVRGSGFVLRLRLRGLGNSSSGYSIV